MGNCCHGGIWNRVYCNLLYDVVVNDQRTVLYNRTILQPQSVFIYPCVVTRCDADLIGTTMWIIMTTMLILLHVRRECGVVIPSPSPSLGPIWSGEPIDVLLFLISLPSLCPPLGNSVSQYLKLSLAQLRKLRREAGNWILLGDHWLIWCCSGWLVDRMCIRCSRPWEISHRKIDSH